MLLRLLPPQIIIDQRLWSRTHSARSTVLRRAKECTPRVALRRAKGHSSLRVCRCRQEHLVLLSRAPLRDPTTPLLLRRLSRHGDGQPCRLQRAGTCDRIWDGRVQRRPALQAATGRDVRSALGRTGTATASLAGCNGQGRAIGFGTDGCTQAPCRLWWLGRGTDTLPIQSPWRLGASSFPCLSCKSLVHCCASLLWKRRDMQSDGNGRADL